MNNKVIEIIEYETESYKVDFKREQYQLGANSKKIELLKDISAFANQISDEDKYIIIGVEDTDGVNKQIFNIENPIDDAKYQQYVLDNIEPKINFEYKTMVYDEKIIAYFRIFNNKNRPYLFKKDINNSNGEVIFKYGDGFIRIGTSSKKKVEKNMMILVTLKQDI